MRSYSSTVRNRARLLRKSSPDAELHLWRLLRNRTLRSFKFRRQHPIAGYIVDFVCLERRLVVELDGGQHSEQRAYDEARTHKLREAGYEVARFWDNDVLKHPQAVLQVIYDKLACPSP